MSNDTALKTIVIQIAQSINAISQVAQKNYLAIWNLVTVVMALKDTDFTEVKLEISQLDSTAKADLETAFLTSLQLDSSTMAKVTAAVSALDSAILLVEEVIDIVNKGVLLLAKVKTLFGA